MSRTQKLVDQLPFYKNKVLTMPFDIDEYIDEQYNSKIEEYKKKYNQEYIDVKLYEFNKQLSCEANYYLKWFDNIFYGPFIGALKIGDKKFGLHYYSYDSDRTPQESFMIEKAWSNFIYILNQKGYPHKIWDEEKQVVDFMDGTITKFIKHIEVDLV